MDKCPYCTYVSKKSNVLNHLKRIEKCNKDIPIEFYQQTIDELKNRPRTNLKSIISFSESNKEYFKIISTVDVCEFCNKKFSTKYTLKNHQKHCFKKKENELLEQQKQLINSFQQIVDSLNDKKSSTINNIDNSTNINYINSNVVNNTLIVNYGKEDFSYITDEIKLNLIKNHCVFSWKYLLDLKHFNHEKPENQNIKLKKTDSKTKYISLFKDGKWVWFIRKEILDELRRDILNDLEEVSDENQPEGMSDYAFKKFRKFLEMNNTDEPNPDFNDKIEVYLYEKDPN